MNSKYKFTQTPVNNNLKAIKKNNSQNPEIKSEQIKKILVKTNIKLKDNKIYTHNNLNSKINENGFSEKTEKNNSIIDYFKLNLEFLESQINRSETIKNFQEDILKSLLNENETTADKINMIKKEIENTKKIQEENEMDVEIKKKKQIKELLELDKILEENCNKIKAEEQEINELLKQEKISEEKLYLLKKQNSELETDLEKDNKLLHEEESKIKSLKEHNEKIEKKNEEKINKTFIIEQINKNYVEHLKFFHNEFQELKGNIRVFCRVRPTLPNELKDIENVDVNYIEYKGNSTIILNSLNCKISNGKHTNYYPQEAFNFDRIFLPEDNQEVIFEEISQLVQSALDGYKVCIFAYGQTGSGKTYTMQGEENEKRGIIPRSLEQIFAVKESLEKMSWKFTIEASCVEIYLDQVRDLLINSPNNVVNQNKPEKFFCVDINKMEDFYSVLTIAANKRSVAQTKCNEKSSRSHCIFQVKINGKNLETKEERFGALNLIDLAGSERISKSKVEEERLKESIAINKSLSALKSVIIGMVNNNNSKNLHIPYRDSALTFILQNYLGRDSKTLMFANISPLFSNHSENKFSLIFASEVNKCYLKSED